MQDLESESLERNLFKYKILLDTTYLFDQYYLRGIWRYGKEVQRRLIKYIVEDEKWEVALIGFYNLEKNLIQLGFSTLAIEEISKEIEFFSLGEPFPSGFKNTSIWNEKYRPVIESIRPDAFFAIHFERGLPSVPEFYSKLRHKPKTIVTAHDAIPLIFNRFSTKSPIHNYFKGKFYKKMWKGVENADLVFSPSMQSKNDVAKYGNVSENKIQVTYLGIDERFYKENLEFDQIDIDSTLNRFELESAKYFFYDSGIEANKGAHTLLEIFSNIANTKSKLPKKLVIIGGDFNSGAGKKIKAKTSKGKAFLRKAKQLGILENIVTTDKITEEELIILLSNAFAHLNFSEYEGFNFGPLQAMAAGIPAIAADASCNPEVTKGGALLVNTQDTLKTSKEIIKFLKDKDLVAEQIKKAKKVVKNYDWDLTATETGKYIKNLVE